MAKLDGHEASLPVYSPVCSTCRHLRDFGAGRRCDAFPDGIPEVIWVGDNDHRQPFPGDGGVTYAPILRPVEPES